MATLPFFDDFSGDSLRPNSLNWTYDISDMHVPGVSITKGLNVPSKGVATFDGATYDGKKYADELLSGFSDSLVSGDFDLSTMTPGDSLYLSFYYQRAGANESPESTDSLILYFDTTGAFTWMPVWAVAGTGAPDADFNLAMIPFDSAQYFNNAFRFKFATFGSLNGEVDVWHLDYVFLDDQRTITDTDFPDTSPINFDQSPMGLYTAVPRDHYQTGGYMTPMRTLVGNTGSSSTNVNISLSLSDPIGLNPLVGNLTVNGSGAAGSLQNDSIGTASYAEQASIMNADGAFQVTATTSSAGDGRSGNNKITAHYRVDSILAYDDGVSDFGYGLTVDRSFCQEYRIPFPDTITAVWINFTPTIHYNPGNNQSTCLEFASFKLTVWDTLVPDSFSTQIGSGMNVQYDSSLNEFYRYVPISPIAVDTVFWVGITQSNGMPIGVGFDRSCADAKFYFAASNGQFQQSTNQGCLMIRPEFGEIPGTMNSAVEAEGLLRYGLKLAPNPIAGGMLRIHMDGPEPVRELQLTVRDLHGRTVMAADRRSPGSAFGLQLPEGLARGMYLVQVNGKTQRGKTFVAHERLVVH